MCKKLKMLNNKKYEEFSSIYLNSLKVNKTTGGAVMS